MSKTNITLCGDSHLKERHYFPEFFNRKIAEVKGTNKLNLASRPSFHISSFTMAGRVPQVNMAGDLINPECPGLPATAISRGLVHVFADLAREVVTTRREFPLLTRDLRPSIKCVPGIILSM
jgi:hypothetical protein